MGASTRQRPGVLVDEDEVLRRLSTRRLLVDRECVTRGDDRPETVRHRLQVYPEVTAPAMAALGSPHVSAG